MASSFNLGEFQPRRIDTRVTFAVKAMAVGDILLFCSKNTYKNQWHWSILGKTSRNKSQSSSTMIFRRGDPDKSKNHAKHGCVGFVECKVYFWVANATYKFLNKISFQTNDDSSWQLHSSDYFASRTLSIEISVRLAFWCPSGPEIRWDAFCSCCFLNLNKHAAEQNFRLVSDNSITVRHPLAILLSLAHPNLQHPTLAPLPYVFFFHRVRKALTKLSTNKSIAK